MHHGNLARDGMDRFDRGRVYRGRADWRGTGSRFRNRSIPQKRRGPAAFRSFQNRSASRKSVFGQAYVARHAPIPRT